MNVETTLIEMMRSLNEPQSPNEAQWNRFARRAHRSLWGRRAAAVGTVGMTAFVGTSLVDGSTFDPAPVSPAATNGGEQDTSEVEVWFVKDGELHKTTQESSAGISRNGNTGMVNMIDLLEDALERLFAGPPSGEGLSTAIPAGTRMVDFDVTPDEENGGAAIVRITVSEEMASAEDEQLATAQTVYTATQIEGMASVRLVIAGGNEETSEVQQRDDYENGAEPIVLIFESEPGQEHVLYPSTVVRGTANLDGGQLYYKLFGAGGNVLSRGRIKLGPCTGSDCRRPFARTIPFDIEEEQQGRLEVYIREHGEQTHMVASSQTLKPE